MKWGNMCDMTFLGTRLFSLEAVETVTERAAAPRVWLLLCRFFLSLGAHVKPSARHLEHGIPTLDASQRSFLLWHPVHALAREAMV